MPDSTDKEIREALVRKASELAKQRNQMLDSSLKQYRELKRVSPGYSNGYSYNSYSRAPIENPTPAVVSKKKFFERLWIEHTGFWKRFWKVWLTQHKKTENVVTETKDGL